MPKYNPRAGFNAEKLARSLPPGTVGLSTIEGHVGAFVKFGQRFMGAPAADAKWSHVFLVGHGDDVFQAMPNGAEKASLAEYLAETAAGDEIAFIHIPASEAQGARAVETAERLAAARVGYSFATYVYLFLRRLRVPLNGWLRRRIARTDRLICSQLVDLCLTEAGVSVFDDCRARQDVIPADFAGLMHADPDVVTVARFEV